MKAVERTAVEEALAEITDTNTGRDLMAEKAIRDIRIDGAAVTVSVRLGYPAAGYRDELAALVRDKLTALPGIDRAEVEIDWEILSHAVQGGLKPMAGVKNIIAVASGKGGVGKSTTAVNLALALRAEGARAGILDADIYGPSQPRMLGLSGKPETHDGKRIEPMEGHGIQAMSIGFLIDEETPMVWRGPMVTQALTQLLSETNWGELDYLIVDLPPGTGDIQLTLCQKVPVTGALIVTTPQDIALLDARKALGMFRKVNVDVLGIVENMSTHICSNCGHEEHIFGEGGGQRMAEQYEVDLLGSLPLDIHIREEADSGRPTVAAQPDSPVTASYREIARRTAGRLASKSRDYSAKFPKIVVEDN